MKISIITINLNNVSGLEKTILSIIQQDCQNFEYIVIDGGSTDGSIVLLDRYSDRINYFISEPDNGIYNAMNKGIKEARGEYCLFLNSGDRLYNSHVLSDIDRLEVDADIITANAFVETKNNKLQKIPSPKEISFYTFYHHTILHQSTLIRTSLFNQIGFYNENLKIVSDWEFFIKALFLNNCVYKSTDIIISVFDNNGISSRIDNSEICRKEREEVFRNYFRYFLPDYYLLTPRSTYQFLFNLQKSKFLKSGFIFLSRLINKLFKILHR